MKRNAVVLLLLCLILLLCYQWFSIVKLKHDRDYNQAYRQFYEDAAKQVCLKKEVVIEAAEAQGFHYTEQSESDGDLLNHSAPSGAVYLVNVDIKPDPFLAPATFTTFPFGKDGCWISGK